MKKTMLLLALAMLLINCTSYSQSDAQADAQNDATTTTTEVSGNAQWRGPARDGIYPETNLLQQWPETGPTLAWHFDELGEGHASVTAGDNQLFTTGMIDGIGYVFAFDNSGKLLWKEAYGKEWAENFEGTRATPRLIDGKLYLLSSYGLVVCMEAGSGKIIWSVDTFEKYAGRNLKWGITENLVVEDGKVICTPGGEEVNIIALDATTGELLWKCAGNKELSAYCSPQIVSLASRKLIVTHSGSKIMGIDFNSGELLWSYDQPNKWSVHANTPLYRDGYIYCASGYGYGSVKLKLADDGSSATKVWFNEMLDNRMGGFVMVNNKIYGSGDTHREWQCIDGETGTQLFTSTEVGPGNVIYADGMLYAYSEKGEVALIKAEADKFAVVGKLTVPYGEKQHWAHLVIDKGRLFVRHGNSLMVYNIAAE